LSKEKGAGRRRTIDRKKETQRQRDVVCGEIKGKRKG
jgi:hypothetical protein